MTCCVAILEKDIIYMGADSAGVAGLDITIRGDQKIFKNGPFLISGTTSFRMLQLLRYKFAPPKQTVGQDDMKYMVTDFIDVARKCFTDNGFGTSSSGGSFLVAYNKNLYSINSDFQVGISQCKYDAVGCGHALAKGALFATKGKKPLERIKIALEAAGNHSGGVAPPYVIMKQ